MATDLGLGGWVFNDSQGVLIEVTGSSSLVNDFVGRLKSTPPPLAVVESVEVEALPLGSGVTASFAILTSETLNESTVLVPSDVRTCTDCLREMRDPANRRYRHPLINCTNCGPRFTIVRGVPYDRANTTMANFAMCADCTSEYRDPSNRRFHAEPICCLACGPRLRFRWVHNGDVVDGDGSAIDAAVKALKSGAIVALKGVGGYQLTVLASNDAAVEMLRQRKQRDEKPLAVQVATVDAARELVELNSAEIALLEGPEAPIVLARRSTGYSKSVSVQIAPGSSDLGIMLPASGVHQMLADAVGDPLVMTSGNLADEPIVFTDGAGFRRIEAIADAVLSHDRAIHRRSDDSVVRSLGATTMVLRRARGFVPNPISLAGLGVEFKDRCVLGVGAELKNTVCMTRGPRAFVSTHLGDLEHVEAFRSFRETIDDLQNFLQVRPSLILHDLHPEYLSSKWAHEQDAPMLAVQHHHAHVASSIAEHGIEGRVLGLAFDGHGYGPDGTLWGGEFLVADLHGYERAGHLRPVPLPGGATAIRDPWRMAVAYLQRAYETTGGDVPSTLSVRRRNESGWDDVTAVSRSALTMQTSSVGRLFDAIAAILGVRDRCTFEGQAAVGLEQLARRGIPNDRLLAIRVANPANSGEGFVLDPSAFVRSLAEAVGDRQPTDSEIESLAYSAHRCIADAAIEVGEIICAQRELVNVVLSGGVFQNVLLTEMVRSGLEAAGRVVFTHQRVPANDGGISLGQVAIGLAHLTRSEAK